MPTRRPVPVTDQEYADLCDCRCPDAPDVHPAGQCARVRAKRVAAND